MKFVQSLLKPDQEFLGIPYGFLCSPGIVCGLWIDSDYFFWKKTKIGSQNHDILDLALSATPPTFSTESLLLTLTRDSVHLGTELLGFTG